MKLGTQTASVVNSLLASATIGQPEPVVGMGATILCWTDRHAATVFRVFKFRGLTAVEVREDHATRTDDRGLSEMQDYSYKVNVRGCAHRFAFKDGRWRELVGSKLAPKGSGHGLQIGARREYHDFSF